MPKKTKEPSEFYELFLNPKLEKICSTYKKSSPETRKRFIAKFNRTITKETELDDFVRDAMFSFRDSLIERYG